MTGSDCAVPQRMTLGTYDGDAEYATHDDDYYASSGRSASTRTRRNGRCQTASESLVSRSISSDARVSSGAASSAANWEILLALAIGAVMPG